MAEVALALALLATAGVMIRGFERLLQRDQGWDTVRVLAANIHLPEQSIYQTEDSRRLAIEKLARRLAQIPHTEHTGICSTDAALRLFQGLADPGARARPPTTRPSSRSPATR